MPLCLERVGFYDHMLTALARHALLDLEVTATGEDTALAGIQKLVADAQSSDRKSVV